MKRKWLGGIFAAWGMLALVIDSKTAIFGAQDGLKLCLQGVIPSLLPFIFLSQLLVSALIGSNNAVFLFIERILHIPNGSGSIYIAGLLGGYPTGAQLVAQSYRNKVLSHNDANRMLSFCTNAGPAFLFGILGQSFSDRAIPWLLWLIHIISSVAVAQIIPGKSARRMPISRPDALSPAEALRRSVSILAQICGWVLLFKVLGTFIDRWFLFIFTDEVRLCVTGFLELTAGCMGLAQIENEGLRMILASAFLAFGGLCVAMQTASVCTELDTKNYILGKTAQCLISIILTAIGQHLLLPSQKADLPLTFWLLLPASIAIFVLFLRKNEKNSSISHAHGVQLVPR